MYRVFLLGEPVFQGPGGPLDIPHAKGKALLWYCAAAGQRLFSRHDLANLFWGESARSLDSLNTTLNRLRGILPVWPLRSVGNFLGWDPQAGIWVDVQSLRALTEKAGHGGVNRRDVLEETAQLFRGPFLENVHLPACEEFTVWQEAERQRLALTMAEVLADLVECWEEAGDWEKTAFWAGEGLHIDPFREGFHRAVMRAHVQRGDPAAALDQFLACERLLGRELGIRPSSDTLSLRDSIATGSPRVPAPRSASGSDFPPHHRVVPTSSEIPFLGREDVMRFLRTALAQPGGEGKRLILISGEAGVGKTRLIEEMIREYPGWQDPEPETPSLLLGHCYEEVADLPYAPFLEILRGGLARLDLADTRLADVWLGEIGRLLPEIDSLRSGLPPWTEADPQEGRLRLFQGVEQCLRALPQPALLVLEDLHWADEATLLLLAYLARQDHGLCLLVTVRTGDISARVERLLGKMEREGHLLRLELLSLSCQAIGKLTAEMMGRENPVLTKHLYEITKGLPFFAIEFLRALRESGALDKGVPPHLDPLPVPVTVQAVIQERFSHLDAPALDFLQAAAILPGGGSFLLLQQVSNLGEDTALASLERLLAAGILREDRQCPETFPGMGQVGVPHLAFVHELVGRVALEEMSRTKCRMLHRRAYAALEQMGNHPPASMGTAMTGAKNRSFHAIAGGLWEEGMRWSLRAAEEAEVAYAYDGALRFLQQALECLERLPPTPERRQQEAEVRHHWMQTQEMMVAQQPADYMDAEVGELPSTAVPGEKSELEPMVAKVFPLFIQGRIGKAQSILGWLLPVIQRSGSQGLRALSLKYAGQMHVLRGDFPQAESVLREAMQYERRGGRLHPPDAFSTLAAVLGTMGEFPQAHRMLEEIAAREEVQADSMLASHTLLVTAIIAYHQGDWAIVAQATREGMAMAREGRNKLFEYNHALCHGIALARLGDLGAGLRSQEESIALAERNRGRALLDRAYGWLGQMCLEAGDVEGAVAAATTGLRISRTDGYLYGQALNTMVFGQIAASQGRTREAQEQLQEALRQFGAIGVRPQVARCHAVLAGCAGRKDERTNHRRLAEDLLISMDMKWDLDRLQAAPWDC